MKQNPPFLTPTRRMKMKLKKKMGCLRGCFRPKHHHRDQCVSMSMDDRLKVGLKKLPPEEEEEQDDDEIASLIKHVSLSNSRVEMEELTNGKKSSVEMKSVEDENGCSTEDDKLGKSIEGEAIAHTPDPVSENGPQEFIAVDTECPLNSKVNITMDKGINGGNVIKESSCCCPESSESLFSLSIDSRRQFSAAETGDKEVISPLKLPENALCEVEEDDDDSDNKENVQNSPPSSKKAMEATTTALNETSLSSWLAGSAVSCHNKSNGSSPESEKNYGGRQVLAESQACLSVTSHKLAIDYNTSSISS